MFKRIPVSSKIMLTQDQKDLYVNNCGEWCPYCESKTINTTINDTEFMASVIYQTVSCHTCGKTWIDIYRLVDVKESPEI